MLAEALIKQPLNESVCRVVAEKLRAGCLWMKLARDLKVKDSIIYVIKKEERADGKGYCRAVLEKWCEINSPHATNRELMMCLTNMGYGSVNWHIMRELNLVAKENMPQSER